MLIIFTVNDQKVTHDLGQRTLVAGSSGVVQAAFTFDNSWDGLDVVVVFSNSGKKCNNKPIKMEDIFNQTSPIQEKYVGTGNLVSFWGLTKDLLDEMEAVQNDLASDIELLELCVTNRPVEGNPFVVTFETLNNLDVEGVWETANKRISF